MGKLGEAVVEVRADLRGLDGGLAAGERQVKSFVGGANATLAKLGAAALGGALAAGLGATIADATLKAADFGETLSKVKATFGKDAKAITDNADAMADRFGKVKKETIDAATTFGLLGMSVGMTRSASAALGVELTNLAADVESFMDVPLNEVLMALRSGLTGEAEPMRRFGVFLSEDAVKAEALRIGLVKTTGAMTEQQKVLARLSIIKNTPSIKKAGGDLDRTADSAKNQLRKLQGDVENFKTAFGEAFIQPLTHSIALARELGAVLDKAAGGKGTVESAGETASAWVQALRQATAAPGKTLLAGVLDAAGAHPLTAPIAGAAKAMGLGPDLQADADKRAGVVSKAAPPPKPPPPPTPAQARDAALAKAAAEKKASLDAYAKREKDVGDFKRAQSLKGLGQAARGVLGHFLETGRFLAPKEKPIPEGPTRGVQPGHSQLDTLLEEKRQLSVGPSRAELEAGGRADKERKRDETLAKAAKNLGRTLGPEAARKFLEPKPEAEAKKPPRDNRLVGPVRPASPASLLGAAAAAVAAVSKVKTQADQPKKEIASGQVLHGSEAAAELAQTEAVSNDLAKQTAEATKETAAKVGDAVEQLKELVKKAAERAGAILRGRS